MNTYTDSFLSALATIPMSERAFCAKYGINRTSLHLTKRGERLAQTEWLIILAQHFGFNPEWLLLGKGKITKNTQINVQEKNQ